ncbi:sporulation integral membrane protein YtvI [Paenibacillus sp. JX-17]|uniref:Sporulation integral membrane protein YtvI n=1 Tax=Paenibacillus lacisoli TaxID=3064525 RepID=A0ABT9CA22_9BACL|nr:sporulation integral membrane protein YtvI [Paenibacillus sp. JX-17]MDO7906107.1 sporulation integral membrane protein YtvI [Paenibacillus sp. JX-17]
MDRLIIKRILRALWVVVATVAIILAMYWLFPLIYPFLIAWLIAYAMNPLVRLLQRRARMPRWLAVTLSLLIYIGGLLLVLSAAVTRIVKEIINLSQSFDVYVQNFRDLFVSMTQSESIQNIISQINNFIKENPDYQKTINNNIDKTTQTVSSAVTDIVTGFFNWLLNLLSSLPNMGAVLIVVILATFFISKKWTLLGQSSANWVPAVVRKPVSTIWRDLQKALFGYLRAQLILISITAVVVIIGLLVLRVPSAFTIGLMIGLVDLLPYLGVGLVMIPWLIYAFMSHDIPLGIGLSVLYGIILIARQIIEPKVLASSVGLDPLATLIAMFIGLKLFGVLGLIIGPVSLVILDAFNRANVFRDLRTYVLSGRR